MRTLLRKHWAITLAALVVLVGAAALGVAASLENQRQRDAHLASVRAMGEPVSRAEAEQLLGQVVRLVRHGQYQEICKSVTDDRGTCKQFLWSARSIGRTPGAEPPKVVGHTRTSCGSGSYSSLILHLEASDGVGKPYTADFAVTRNGDGKAVAYTPIYWSGVHMDSPGQRSCR